MKVTRIASLGLVLVAALAFAVEAVKVKDLVAKPEKFDGKVVKVSGTVKKFKAKTSRAGNDYFTFDLVESDRGIEVYGRGKLDKEPKIGDKVEVSGKFVKEKTIGKGEGAFTVKNQVDVSGAKKGDKPSVKILSK